MIGISKMFYESCQLRMNGSLTSKQAPITARGSVSFHSNLKSVTAKPGLATARRLLKLFSLSIIIGAPGRLVFRIRAP